MATDDRRWWRPAELASLIAIALVPTFMLAREPSLGATLFAVVPTCIATIVVVGIVLRTPRLAPGALAGLALGPVVPLALSARAWTERPLAGAHHAVIPFVTEALAAIAVGLVTIAVARLCEKIARAPGLRVAAPLVAAAMLGGALAIDGTAAVRGDAPSATERLDAIVADAHFDVLANEEAQSATVARVTVARTCSADYCALEVTGLDSGSRVSLGELDDRAPLAIFRFERVIAIVPAIDGAARWDHARVFDARTGDHASLTASDLHVAHGLPRAWRWSAWAGIALALAALFAAWMARRRSEALERAIDADVDSDGTLRLEGGTIARSARPVPSGPAIVLDLELGSPSYREDGIARARDVVPGFREVAIAALHERATALELAAIGAIALTHATLLAAWLAGYAVRGL